MATRRSRQEQLGQVIASRRFRIPRDDRRFAEVRIGLPVADGRNAFCPVQLVGIGDERVHRIYGVDSVQALQLATRMLEVMFLRYGAQLMWHDQTAHESFNPHASRSLFQGPALESFLADFADLCLRHAGRIQKRQSRRTSG